MTSKPSPKTALITGCSEGGIGDALAREFHIQGFRVFATARNLSKVEHLKTLGIETLPLDVIDETSIRETVETVRKLTGGTLDVLVNNSGGGYSAPLLDADLSVGKKMFDVNIWGLLAVTQAFAPLLIASKGTIINIGSIAGFVPSPWQGLYNASKAAVNLLTDNLRLELSPLGVKAIVVITGVVRTKFLENLAVSPKVEEGSVYAPGKAEIEAAMKGSTVEDGQMDVDEYAKAVVANALKKSPNVRMWIGGKSWSVWFADTFAWATIWDTVLPGLVKMPQITNKIQAARKLM